MKLFQNLSTDLAKEVVKSLFLFIALAAILFNGAKTFEYYNFGGGLAKEHLCEIISKSVHRFSRRSHLKVLLFIALAAILFNRAERLEQFW